jgi:hypothetical protein
VHEPTATPTALMVAVRDDGTETVLGRVDAANPDVALVDALMRIRLIARRYGRRVCLREIPDDLRDLLELVGLLDVLRVEPARQAELGEQLGVDEVVQAGDDAV